MTKSRDYLVGHGKPPREHQFPPGKSGNPKGRPKGARSVGDEVRAALAGSVTVNENSRKRRMSIIEAAVKKLIQRGMSGDRPSIELIVRLAETYTAKVEQATLGPDDRTLFDEAIAELRREFDEGNDR